MGARLTAKAAIAAAFLAALGGCAAKVDGGAPPAQSVRVVVSPASVALIEEEAIHFAAQVTGTAETEVTWQIDEAGGGTIDRLTGAYVAPGAPGTFHVRAVSRADPRVSGVTTVTVTAPLPGSVSISPRTTTVLVGGTTTFATRLTGLSGGVTYGIQEASGCGSVTEAGVYTAPATARTCHVVAMSTADSTRTDVATVTVVTPVVVTLNTSTASVDACRTVTFTATVSGAPGSGVTWSVAEGSAGGTVSNGVYTAPSNPGTYHVVATSTLQPASRAQATVTVTERVISVTLDPTAASVGTGGTLRFNATLTTTCGTFVATGS